jgi:hypothetical protein
MSPVPGRDTPIDEKLVSLRNLNIAAECVSALCGPESRAPDMVHALKPAQAALAEILDGPREFVDLTVVQDVSA